MAQIFAGEAEFTTPRPFEASSARVKLSFTVTEGEHEETAALMTGQMARRVAERMITGILVDPHTATPEPEVRPTRRRGAAAPAEPSSLPAPTSATEAPAATIAEAGKAEDPFLAGGAPVSNAPASVPGLDTVSNEAQQPPAPEITDAMLQDAITKKNGDARNTAAIKELIVTYTNDPLIKIYAVTDQAKRAEFLVKLNDIKAAI